MHEEFELAAVVQAVEIAVQEQEAAAMREAERFRRLEEARAAKLAEVQRKEDEERAAYQTAEAKKQREAEKRRQKRERDKLKKAAQREVSPPCARPEPPHSHTTPNCEPLNLNPPPAPLFPPAGKLSMPEKCNPRERENEKPQTAGRDAGAQWQVEAASAAAAAAKAAEEEAIRNAATKCHQCQVGVLAGKGFEVAQKLFCSTACVKVFRATGT